MTGARFLRFGDFCVDCREGRVWCHTTPLALSRKPHGLLTLLATHAGELVTKEALLNVVWPRAAVVEAVLTTAVRDVRRALGDDARRPRFIETVHGRGYRFIAPVFAHDTFGDGRVDDRDTQETVTLILMALCATLDGHVDEQEEGTLRLVASKP